jgi:HD superfamily phosphohydrolase YqeK
MGSKEGIEDFVRKNLTDCTLTHDFSHFRRVAAGASWFVKILGGGREEQELAYIAGLLHDSVRPDTERVDHARASAEKSRGILEGFGFDKDIVDRICQAIGDHRKPAAWSSPLHQSVYLADKILEQMGHYVAFRRCMYVGECRDYKGKPFEESIEKHFAYRIAKFGIEDFPERFRGFVRIMMRPSLEFQDCFVRREAWAVSLARFCYDAGRSKDMAMDEAMRAFRTEGERAEKWKSETLAYMDGKKFREWEKLI